MTEENYTKQDLINEYLTRKGSNATNATAALMSDATAYAECYDWYIRTMKVLPENATLASGIWVDKYALHNKEGICLEMTPPDMWDRLAKTLADVEMQGKKGSRSNRFFQCSNSGSNRGEVLARKQW